MVSPTSVRRARPFGVATSTSNGAVNLADSVVLLAHLFRGGAAPACAEAADLDENGTLNLSDAVYGLRWLFQGGAEPPRPGVTACGAPSAKLLGCDDYTAC